MWVPHGAHALSDRAHAKNAFFTRLHGSQLLRHSHTGKQRNAEAHAEPALLKEPGSLSFGHNLLSHVPGSLPRKATMANTADATVLPHTQPALPGKTNFPRYEAVCLFAFSPKLASFYNRRFLDPPRHIQKYYTEVISWTKLKRGVGLVVVQTHHFYLIPTFLAGSILLKHIPW